ncbi:MAG TPA: VWA domain-containing protein, partial [Thermoanaerobaculia bacterium]|nr:VWA domain-containing protein [Thermoanaerobaculia bacterium]
VEFFLDGRKIMSKREPPYELDLDLGSVPMMRRVRVVGRSANGDIVTGDEVLVNAGSDPFRVHIVSPRVIGRVAGDVRVVMDVKVPEGKRLQGLELYLNETRLVTLYEPPFVQTIRVPGDLEVGYLRAVATLQDERKSQTEDLVFLNTPEFFEQIDVHLVELPTSVTRDGRPVADLPKSAFQVFDEGQPVEIAKFDYVRDLPLSVGVAIDSSGSMKSRLLQAQKAGASFFSNVLKPGDKGFVVAFDSQPRVVQKWTNDLGALTSGLASLRAEEATALHDAIIYSLYNFQGVRGQKALVLLSDGQDTASRFEFSQAIEYARRSAVPIFTIGLGIQTGDIETRRKLRELASETGGNSWLINHPSDLSSIYAEIERELRAQYVLGFYPPAGITSGAKWREVRVRVDGANVKTIRGYYP